ncbi:TrbI/VirB10 family protein [Nitrosomonas ureae]|uniref:Type IV secretion system protein VirB10 n=1 Tax=Nitrosomonas ureae TaxID=44577 RepID=A0A286AL87_9PROT|nr:TrbI/VirB10 family protein [Nitrosomonas ureae]SOD22671.1 type IV secretion system protein VirB10 [Nitrosomonas ureae]
MNMAADASPDTVSSSGVRRVNNLPIYIVVGIMLVFLLIMMVVAMNRAEPQQSANAEESKKAGSSNTLAAFITGEYKEGFIEAERPAPLEPALDLPPEIIIARPGSSDNLDLPPLPPPTSLSMQEINPDLEHIRMMKLQLFEQAVKAKTHVPMEAPRSAGSSLASTPNREEALARIAAVRQQVDAEVKEDPAATYLARLQHIRDSGLSRDRDSLDGLGSMDSLAPELIDTDTKRPNNDYANFDATGQGSRWELDSKPAAPETPYSLLTGFVIPAVLISGINSELPGQIMAQVSQDIYDTPVGKHRLVPQGARLVGEYSSDVAYGQSRVLVAWQRIIFPDGKTMDIGAMPGADGIGQAGFKDQVNNHYLRIFGSALLMSAVIAGATYSQRDAGGGGVFGRQNAGSILSQSLGQQLGQATTRLMMKNLNIAPTLEIRPGFRFNVIVTKDMVFSKPYQSFDY